jgi:hypothetical protein
MEETAFRAFLAKGGRSPSAAARVIGYVSDYESYLTEAGTTLDEAGPAELESFVAHFEASGDDARLYLWAIAYWYEFAEEPFLAHVAGEMRRVRVEESPFRIRGFKGVDASDAERLERVGVGTVPAVLEAGATPARRCALSDDTGVSLEAIEDLVRLSDLARLSGVKGVRARLYVDAGIRSIPDLAAREPAALCTELRSWVEESGFEGLAPFPAEVAHSVEAAGRLEEVVTW